jgi:circadian clock protein KaiB
MIGAQFVFRLYVTGTTRASARAVVNTRSFCERQLPGRYRLEVVNVADDVDAAVADQVVASPTLIKLQPEPLQRFIGDLSDAARLAGRLQLPAEPALHG